MTIEEASRLLVASLTDLYDEREASTIGSMVLERLTGMPKSLRILQKGDLFTTKQQEIFQYYLEDLLKYRPVQYVLGEAWFGPYPFFVDENVLIPRPETEELADWILKDSIAKSAGTSILDIGTGSGCIPVYLKKKRKDFNISGADISEAALAIAKKNADVHDAEIDFFLCDIQDRAQWESFHSVDIIVSNPPYIPLGQKAKLDRHVRDFEPDLALFVPDEDPIRFYKIIGDFATEKLRPAGAVFLEIHHDYAAEIIKWYEFAGFSVELKKDFTEKNRMLKAKRI